MNLKSQIGLLMSGLMIIMKTPPGTDAIAQTVEFVSTLCLGNICIARLSLLTKTNPNQMQVCSKTVDKTNLSFKLPVADRTREV